MKKAGLVMTAMLTLTTAWAQTILTENFETATPRPSDTYNGG